MAEPDIVCRWRKPCGTRFRPRGTLASEWRSMRVLTPAGYMDMGGMRHTGWFPWVTVVRGSSLRTWPSGWSYEEVRVAMQRRKPTEGMPAVPQISLETQYLFDFPHLIEHLSCRAYDDKTSRVPGTLMLSMMGSVWRMVLKDPDSRQQLQLIAPSLDEVLLAAEVALGAQDAPWEPDPWAKGTGSKKSGK